MPSTVLIVEDDPRTREGLAGFLEEAGYEVTAVATFDGGLQHLRTTPPDLLIADVRLGPYNGLQLVISSPRPIPAIIITGYADPVLESDAKRRGAEYILKPVNPGDLLRLVGQKIAASRKTFCIPRRWERMEIVGGLPAHVEDVPGRIVDISYGGVRLELEQRPDFVPPSSFRLTLPSADLIVPADLVWKTPIGDHTWICGVSLPDAASTEWQGLVDAMS